MIRIVTFGYLSGIYFVFNSEVTNNASQHISFSVSNNVRKLSTMHSAIKGHVPNQSLYKGWEQSFPSFFLDQKMDIVFCQEGQFIKCRNENYFLLVRF